MSAATRGMLWMVAAALFFSASVGFVRHLSDTMSTFEIVLFRQIIGLAFMLPWLFRVGPAGLRTGRIGLQGLRSLMSYLGMLASYYSFTLIAIADAIALQFTTPLFTTIFAIIFLKELVGGHRWMALAFGFAGVLLIVRPGFADVNVGIPAALCAAAFYAASNVVNRALTRTDSTPVIVFYSFALQLPLAAIPAALAWTTPGWADLPALLGFGVVAVGAQWCLTRALTAADASLVEPVMFVRMPCVAVIGYVFFAQVPDGWTWVGAVVIFTSTWVLARREAAHRRRLEAV